MGIRSLDSDCREHHREQSGNADNDRGRMGIVKPKNAEEKQKCRPQGDQRNADNVDNVSSVENDESCIRRN